MPVLLALLHQVDVVVRDAVMTNLAALFQLLKAFDRLLDGSVEVGPVDQQQVEEICIQPSQTALCTLDHVALRRIETDHGRRVVVVKANLGHQDNLVASIAQRFSQQFLGEIGAVTLGRVEQGDPTVDRHVDGLRGLIHVDVAVHVRAHLPGAEAHRRSHQVRVAKSSLFHF